MSVAKYSICHIRYITVIKLLLLPLLLIDLGKSKNPGVGQWNTFSFPLLPQKCQYSGGKKRLRLTISLLSLPSWWKQVIQSCFEVESLRLWNRTRKKISQLSSNTTASLHSLVELISSSLPLSLLSWPFSSNQHEDLALGGNREEAPSYREGLSSMSFVTYKTCPRG